MVALSTCSTSGTNARHVLICRIVHSSASEEGSGKVYVETENAGDKYTREGKYVWKM